MSEGGRIRRFFIPPLSWGFGVRVSLVALVAYLFFGYVCIPLRIHGRSMEPTYRDGSYNFCWRPRYLRAEPKRFDVVLVRFAGEKVMLLKRVVALEGETVAFRHGKLLVDGREIEEPYVRYRGDWNLAPRRVKPNHLYLVGDNRAMPIENQVFGQTSIGRIVGSPLW